MNVDPDEIGLNTSLTAAAIHGREATIQFLLDRGADPNTISMQDMTPLMHASASANASVVQLLLEWGVDLEIKDSKGVTALTHAAMRKSTEAVIQLLLEKGADINTKDNVRRGVVFYAASENRYNNLTVLFTSSNIRNIHRPDHMAEHLYMLLQPAVIYNQSLHFWKVKVLIVRLKMSSVTHHYPTLLCEGDLMS